MEKTEAAPGVTLRLIEQTKMGSSTGKKRVRLIMDVEITDERVWRAAEAKLEQGLHVYTVEDFQTEMLHVLRQENRQLEQDKHALSVERTRLLTQNADLNSSLRALVDREQVRAASTATETSEEVG